LRIERDGAGTVEALLEYWEYAIDPERLINRVKQAA
jgi:hypothetical protein